MQKSNFANEMPSSKADIVATKTAAAAVVVVVALKCIKCSRLEEVEEKKNKFGIGTKSLMELSTYYSRCVFVTLSFDFSQLADISLSIVIHVGIYYFSLWWCSSGQVTNLRGYFSDEPSSTPSDIQIIFLIYCAKRRKRIKEAGLLPT